MNYWERWIGDWKRKTAHLSFEEKGAYGELLDYLYSSDMGSLPPSKDSVYRIAGAQSNSERKAVDVILAQFFAADDAGFHQKRATEEISKRKAYLAGQREFGKRRWEKEKNDAQEKKLSARSKTPSPPIEIPTWLNKETFCNWIATRPARARKTVAQQAAIEKLSTYKKAGHDPNAIVQDSLANGWQGLFAPDEKKGEKKKTMRTCAGCGGEITERGSWVETSEGPKHSGCVRR